MSDVQRTEKEKSESDKKERREKFHTELMQLQDKYRVKLIPVLVFKEAKPSSGWEVVTLEDYARRGQG